MKRSSMTLVGSVRVLLVMAVVAVAVTPRADAGVARDITTASGWKFMKGTNEPPSNWHTRDFDDSAWSDGSMPFWYGDTAAGGTQLSDMQNGYTTLYMRYTFTNYNAIAITSMVFSADYDDAFIVWLNDVEVYRTPNVPGTITYNATATGDHESSAGSPTVPWVTNILLNPSETYFIWPSGQKISVQAFNVTAGSSDFHMNMKVVANNMFVSNAIKVACVGSSTTQGHQNVPNSFHTSYPSFLQLMLGPGYEVRNYGHNGKTLMRTLVGNVLAPDSFADNPNTPGWYHSVAWQPDMVCIQLGVNDAHTNRNWNGNKQNFSNEYDYLVNSYTNHGGTPTRVICGTPPWVATNYFAGSYIGNPDNVDGWDWADDGHVSNLQIGPIVRSYAAARGLAMVDVEAFTEGHWPDWYNAGGVDALHMSTLGHSNVALCVSNSMKSPAIQIQASGEWLVDGSASTASNNLTDFGSATITGGLVDHTFTITNFGASALTLTGSPRVVISGASASDFSVVAQPASNVPAGGSTSFTIRFDPNATGARTATVSIANNDFTKAPFDFAVQGSGQGGGAVLEDWTAYNDCAYHTNEPAATGFTTNSPWGMTSGSLKDTNGAAIPVTVTFSGAATLLDRNFVIPVGTDADTWFSGHIGPNHAANWSSGTVTMLLSGLTTTKQYRVVIWSTRGVATTAYSNRWTDITLSSADTFANNSSAGCIKLTSTMANDMTRVQASSDGHVARYDSIRPGPDGSIQFAMTANGLAASDTNGYLNAFMIQEQPVSVGITDTDADGMDDAWEQTHFGGLSQPNAGASQDLDNDGFDNYSEYRAGTDPQSASSRLELSGINTPTNQSTHVVLEWFGVTGKTYSIEYRTNLSSGTWSAIQSGISGGALNAYTGSANGGRYYYRVKVE